MKLPPKKRKGAPHWATAPFGHYLDEADRLYHVVRLSSVGISMLQTVPRLVEVLMKVELDDPKDESQRLEAARKDADLAEREVKS